MGRLELPLPQLGKGKQMLESVAKDMQERIRAQAPKDLRASIKVRPFTRGGLTGVSIEYDDKAERFVYVAIEYPMGSGKVEKAVPKDPTR